MKLFRFILGLALAAMATSFSSCSGNKDSEQTNTQDSVQTENTNAARIAELEAQRDAVIRKIEAIGAEYDAAHPDIPEDAIIDSLNVHTADLRQQSRELLHQIDSLKAL